MADEATSKEMQVAHDELPHLQQPSKKDVDNEGAAGRDLKVAEIDGDSDKKPEDSKPGLGVVLDDDHEKKEDEGVSEDSIGSESVPSFREQRNLLSDLKDVEKKALLDLRSKLEDAILNNKLFVFEEEKKKDPEESQKPRSAEKKEEEKSDQVKEEQGGEKEKEKEKCNVINEGQGEEKKLAGEENLENSTFFKEEIKEAKEKLGLNEEIKDSGKKEDAEVKEAESKAKAKEEEEGIKEEEEEEEEEEKVQENGRVYEVDKDIKLWGVHLLPSKGDKGTDLVLIKFLRARDFKSQEAFEMLRNALKWRKDNQIDGVLEEEFPPELSSVAYMQGVDKSGNPICYNIFETFLQDDIRSKIFGTEEMRQKFLRWRFQLMERGIKQLDFSAAGGGSGGATSMLQVNDLRNSPGPTKKEIRLAMKQAVALLQDNYPEFVARNIFINVPFWSYAYYAVVSPFFTQRSKSKCDFARPARVTETLLKYIAAQQIPVAHGGFHRENDPDFSIEDGATEVTIKSGSSESIEILAPEVGTTFTWEITVLGWEVNYKEEFVPADEGSYTMIVQKGRKMTWQEGPLRNSFKNKEPGKLVLTIDNAAFKKKRVLYRYKSKPNPTSSAATVSSTAAAAAASSSSSSIST